MYKEICSMKKVLLIGDSTLSVSSCIFSYIEFLEKNNVQYDLRGLLNGY